MENEQPIDTRTFLTNMSNELEVMRWELQTQRENALSYLSAMPDSTGGSTGGTEAEATDTRLDHMPGEAQGWPRSPTLLPETGTESESEGSNETGFGCLPWQLSDMPESGRSEELCEKGWSIHLESEHGQPQRGECVANSTCLGKRRADHRIVINPREEQTKRPRLMPPWGTDREEPTQTVPPEDGNQAPTEYIQLEHPMGQESDPDLEWGDKYREDEYFEGSVAEWILRHSHGST